MIHPQRQYLANDRLDLVKVEFSTASSHLSQNEVQQQENIELLRRKKKKNKTKRRRRRRSVVCTSEERFNTKN